MKNYISYWVNIPDVTPQIVNNIITSDKEIWTKHTGDFIADGGERYLVLGNMFWYSQTDTIFVGGGTTLPGLFWEAAYYYIDNVSVVEDTSYHPTGIEEEQLSRLQITFTNGQLQANGLIFQNFTTTLNLYSHSGTQVLAQTLPKGNDSNSIPISGIANGVYLYAIKLNGEVVKRGKISITP